MGEMIIEHDGTFIVATDKPIKLPEPQEDGWRYFFHICCQCGLSHEVHLKDDQIVFIKPTTEVGKSLSGGIASKLTALQSENQRLREAMLVIHNRTMRGAPFKFINEIVWEALFPVEKP